MELSELRVFLKVATERSFSRAAMKLHRTQPAVSQAVRRLEDSVGERLFDRATKDATLTEAGRLLRDYAERLQRLSEEAEAAVKDLRDLRRGRVLIGANEASVHVVLPLTVRFRHAHPLVHVDGIADLEVLDLLTIFVAFESRAFDPGHQAAAFELHVKIPLIRRESLPYRF